MEKGNSASESSQSEAYTLFIDTSLDTHLAMTVSDEDTVHDLKQKIMIEHPCCFPKVGEITIHALKVRRKACFYLLSDSMLVKFAFHGIKRNWFLHADASFRHVQSMKNILYLEPGASNPRERFCTIDDPSGETERNYPRLVHPSKSFSLLVDSSLLQVGGSDAAMKLVPPDHQYGLSDVGEEMEKGLNLVVKHESNERLKSSPSDAIRRSGSEVSNKHSLFSEGNGVPQTHTGCRKAKSKKRTREMSYDATLGEALQSGSIAKKKFKNEKIIEDAFGYHVQDILKKNGSETCNSSKEASNPKNMFTENSLKDKEKVTNATSDKLSKSLGNDRLFPCSLVNGKRKKEKKSFSHCDEVGFSVLSSQENVREENSREASGNNNKKMDKESDAAIAPEVTFWSEAFTNLSPISEKEKHASPHGVLSAKTAAGDVESLVANDMGGISGCKVERERDIPDQSVASGGKKAKKSKKHQVASVKGLITQASVENPDSFIRGITPSLYEDGGPKLDNIGTDWADKTENKGMALLGNDQKVMSSEATNSNYKLSDPDEAEMKIKGGVASSNPSYVLGILEAGKPSDKRRKKIKKTMASDAKSHVLSVCAEHVNSVDAIPSRPEPDKAVDRDCPDDETNKEDNILSQTEKTVASKINDGGSDDDNIGTALPVTSEKKARALPQKGDPKIMFSEAADSKWKSLGLDESKMNMKDVVLSSGPLDCLGIVEAGYPSDRRRKKSKKTKTSDTKIHVSTSDAEHGVGAGDVICLRCDPDKAFGRDHPSDKTEMDNISSRSVETKVLKMKSPNALLLSCDKGADKGSANKSDSFQPTEITRAQEAAGYNDDKVKMKSIKNLTSTSNIFLDLPMEQQIAETGHLTPSTDEKKEEGNATFKKMKKLSSRKSLINHLSNSMPKAGKVGEIRTESSQQRHISCYIGSSQKSSGSIECNVEGEPLVNGHTNGAVIVPNIDNDKELKANKKKKKLNVHSRTNLPDVQKTLYSNENQGHKKKPQGEIFDSIIAGDRVKAPTCNDWDKIVAFPSKVSRAKVVDSPRTVNPVDASPICSPSGANANMSSRENNVASGASSSSTGSSQNQIHKNKGHVKVPSDRYRGTVRKSCSKNKKEVQNISNNEKSLLATSNTIFKDSTSESSEDEGGVNNSETSTKSPSDNSSSSQHSNGENEANMDTPGNGSYALKRVEINHNNITKSQSAGSKNMSLDTILRSSRSYKKAKLTASQSQPRDSESEPIEFVPDTEVQP